MAKKRSGDWLDNKWARDNRRDRAQHIAMLHLIYPKMSTQQAGRRFDRTTARQVASKNRAFKRLRSSPSLRDDVIALVTARDMITVMLRQLAEIDRTIVALIGWHGLSTREAAKIAGVSQTEVRRALRRAKNVIQGSE